MPLLEIRNKFIEELFPDELYLLPLQRRIECKAIESYRNFHNNKFPPISCVETITNFIHRRPNRYVYDYSCDTIQLKYLFVQFIKKYNPEYQYFHSSFNLNFLKVDYGIKRINEIDKFFYQLTNKTRHESHNVSLSSVMDGSSSQKSILRKSHFKPSKLQMSSSNCIDHTTKILIKSNTSLNFDNTLTSVPGIEFSCPASTIH